MSPSGLDTVPSGESGQEWRRPPGGTDQLSSPSAVLLSNDLIDRIIVCCLRTPKVTSVGQGLSGWLIPISPELGRAWPAVGAQGLFVQWVADG